MTKEKFSEKLTLAIDSLIELVSSLCFNSFALQYRFIVRPNSVTPDPHLDQEEIAFLSRVITYKDKYLTKEKVIDLLLTNDKVPLWINVSVIESIHSWTTIELLISRRLRVEKELNKVVDQYPPFHIQVPLPPNRVDGEKFDVNWRIRNSKKGFWESIKRFVVECKMLLLAN